MAKVIGGAVMSLDGFINDRSGSVERLYLDLEAYRQTEFLQDYIRMTGAVIMGRGAYDMGQGDFTGYEYQVPIFVLTHRAPAAPARGQNDRLHLHFVTDGLESAVQQAKAAAGDKVVTVVGGASTVRQLLEAGLLDELEVGIAPVLLGDGLRLFDHLAAAPIELQRIRVTQLPGATQMLFRVVPGRSRAS